MADKQFSLLKASVCFSATETFLCMVTRLPLTSQVFALYAWVDYYQDTNIP